jgi:preprotein translocase subunit YajC
MRAFDFLNLIFERIVMISISQLFISNAYAEGAAPAPQGGGIMEFLPLIALLAVFYFLVLRPQQKRAKEHKALLEALQKGDEVITAGGILGKVSKVGDDNASLEIAENVVIQVQKASIQNVLPKGTIKSL